MSKIHSSLLLTISVAALMAAVRSTSAADSEGVGYDDTPMLPGQKWRVHDKNRPVPAVVTPAERFSHGAQAPSDAVVLFDGQDLSKWTGKEGEAKWKVENGYMEGNKSGSIATREEFGDFQLHLEWAAPMKVEGHSQERGNSGVIIYATADRPVDGYEIQVLDSYDNRTYADGQAGALYGQSPPLKNAMKKPGDWNSYDFIWEAPHWDPSGKLLNPATVTVIQNGVVLHNKKEFIGKTVHHQLATYKPHPPKGPIVLQDHGNPIRYRNIWIRPLGQYDQE
jgi:hypothetical protein